MVQFINLVILGFLEHGKGERQSSGRFEFKACAGAMGKNDALRTGRKTNTRSKERNRLKHFQSSVFISKCLSPICSCPLAKIKRHFMINK